MMKALIVVFIYLLAVLLLKLFSKNQNKSELDFYLEDNEDEENRDDVTDKGSKKQDFQMADGDAIILAQKVESNLEAEYVMSQNSSEAVQIAMAETKDFEAQKYLLNFPNLCGEALTIICEKPSTFNFNSSTVERWFIDAINRTKLTPKQEKRISQNGKNFVIKRAMILKKDLTATGLVELCRNPGSMNLDSDTVRRWYLDAVKRSKPSEKQQLKMVESKNFAILRALLLSEELKGETLAAISESPGTMNLDCQDVWTWFERATRRTELTVEQQVRMAEANNFASNRAILINPNIVYEALIAVCKNTKNFNMRSDVVQRYFKDATSRLLPKLSDKQKIELAQTKINGVLKGLK